MALSGRSSWSGKSGGELLLFTLIPSVLLDFIFVLFFLAMNVLFIHIIKINLPQKEILAPAHSQHTHKNKEKP